MLDDDVLRELGVEGVVLVYGLRTVRDDIKLDLPADYSLGEGSVEKVVLSLGINGLILGDVYISLGFILLGLLFLLLGSIFLDLFDLSFKILGILGIGDLGSNSLVLLEEGFLITEKNAIIILNPR